MSLSINDSFEEGEIPHSLPIEGKIESVDNNTSLTQNKAVKKKRKKKRKKNTNSYYII